MAYTVEQKAVAIAVVSRYDNQVSAAAIDEIRRLLDLPNLTDRTVRNWVREFQSQGAEISTEKIISVVSASDGQAESVLRFTDKEALFIEYYLQCLNATEAARLAGYRGTDASLATIGWRLLRKVEIRAEIDRRLKERHLSADEVLAGLADIASMTMADFIDPETGYLDLERANLRGKMHLIKKHKRTIRRDKLGETETFEIELYDKQAAYNQLGRYHQLFTDRVKVDDWRSEAIADIRNGKITYQAFMEAFGDSSLAADLFRAAGVPIPTE